jgi:hypothetical protein
MRPIWLKPRTTGTRFRCIGPKISKSQNVEESFRASEVWAGGHDP